jgi:hypothetical protein
LVGTLERRTSELGMTPKSRDFLISIRRYGTQRAVVVLSPKQAQWLRNLNDRARRYRAS